MIRFPKGFLWGAASSAYQIEGAVTEDGRGESVWETFCRLPGKIADGSSGDPACDHYHLYKEDVRLLAGLGVGAYRFSIAWPRIFPEGRGRPNAKGLDFYDRLVDQLLANRIVPYVNFYHWDHPQVLENQGGWRNREFTQIFADYAAAMVKKLSDRVTHWMTLNEPPCIAFLSYRDGLHAPGAQEPPQVVNQIVHHVLLAHGLAVQATRAVAKKPAKIGLAHNPDVKIPHTESAQDIAAARLAWRAANELWFDPLFKGEYPDGAWGQFPPDIRAGDLKTISTPMDYMGLNIYHGIRVAAPSPGQTLPFQDLAYPESYPRTTMGWPVAPEAMYWGLKMFSEEYSVPELLVTENGAGFPDAPAEGQVRDTARVDFLAKHLAELHRYVTEGGRVGGYFVWTLMDNFEWAHGYTQRFGLYYTERPSQKRIAKDSAKWMQKTIAENGF